MSEITAEVGGSKATIYSHFPSKEELFVECMMAAAENYMAGTLRHFGESSADPGDRAVRLWQELSEFHLLP